MSDFKLKLFRAWQKLNRRRLLRRWEDMCANDYQQYVKLKEAPHDLSEAGFCDHGLDLDDWCDTCWDMGGARR